MLVWIFPDEISIVRDEEEDLMIIDEPEEEVEPEDEVSFIGSPSKGKRPLPELVALPAKKRRIDFPADPSDVEDEKDEIEVLDLD